MMKRFRNNPTRLRVEYVDGGVASAVTGRIDVRKAETP